MTATRLSSGGSAIDRSRPLTFSFDGRTVQGFEGDTIASALLANDVAVVGRSFKYHRPRGIWGAGVEEPNALVDVSGSVAATPNTRATTESAAPRHDRQKRQRLAKRRRRPQRLHRPFLALHSRRLLLQDLHVAGLAPVRAAHPRGRGPGQGRHRLAIARPGRPDQPPLRRAGGGRWACRPGCGQASRRRGTIRHAG